MIYSTCPNYPKCKNTKPLEQKKSTDETSTAEKTLPDAQAATGMKCEKCGADLVLRNGRYGSFYACSRYPECKFTKQQNKELNVGCPKCGQPLVTRYGRRRVFYGCTGYPNCDFSSWDIPTNEKCPDCGGMLFYKKNKQILLCTKENCGYSRPAPEYAQEGKDDAEGQA